MNVADYLFEKNGARHSDFLIGRERRLTFSDLHAEVAAVTSYLIERFGRRGQRMILMSNDGFFFTVAYLAILRSGNTAVLVEGNADEREFERIAALTTPVARFLSPLRMTMKKHDVIDESHLKSIIKEYKSKDGETVPRRNTDVAHIIFTSGSTGVKKGVMITHENIRANTESIITYLKLTKRDRTAVVLPFFYSYGLSLLHTHVRVGGSLVLCRGRFLAAALDDIHRFRCTGFAGVPSTFELLIAQTNFLGRRFPSLRYLTQAGGHMASETILKIADAFPRTSLFIMYGATEATTRLSYLPVKLLRKKLGSIGKGIPGVRLRVVSSSGRPLKPGETGELIANGKNIMKGYFRDPRGTKEVLRHGWLHTGDLATVDEEGFIFIVGRKKHMIKSAGYRISPHEVEAALKNIAGTAVAVGVSDNLLGEAIALLVEGKKPTEVLHRSILAHATNVLPSYKIPKYVWFVESLPRNASGKINLGAVKALVLELQKSVAHGTIENLLTTPQYAMESTEKSNRLLTLIRPHLTKAFSNNRLIKSWFTKRHISRENVDSLEKIPYVPIQMFKYFDLAISPKRDIVRIVTSSGTTSTLKSRVPLDRATSFNQTRALTATLSTYLGGSRRPFFVIDHAGINAAQKTVSARTMGVRGLSLFSRDTKYLLEEELKGNLAPDEAMLKSLLRKGFPSDGYVFGFTYIIWSVLYKELARRGVRLPRSSAHLFHSGGWKKLEDARVSKQKFNSSLSTVLGIPVAHIHEFYGMAEEGGVLFIDCAAGYKHAPDTAMVIIRDFHTLRPVRVGGTGLIEIVSALPESYYGQAVLTEDIGRLVGVDDCSCGKKGEYFEFLTRVPKAELRGCGDTFRESI